MDEEEARHNLICIPVPYYTVKNLVLHKHKIVLNHNTSLVSYSNNTSTTHPQSGPHSISIMKYHKFPQLSLMYMYVGKYTRKV